MESKSLPIEVPANDKQPRRSSGFLSLSPVESATSPPAPSMLNDKQAAAATSPTISPVMLVPDDNSSTSGSVTDAASEGRRSSSVDRANSSVPNGYRFLRLGHAKPGEAASLGDFVE